MRSPQVRRPAASEPRARRRDSAPAGWDGAQGLADDVGYYGQLDARRGRSERIGHLYPKVDAARLSTAAVRRPSSLGCGRAPSRCPNPACGAEMPLVRYIRALSRRRARRPGSSPIVDAEAKTIAVRGEDRDRALRREGTRESPRCALHRLREPVRSTTSRHEGTGRADGRAAHGHRCRGQPRSRLPLATDEHADRAHDEALLTVELQTLTCPSRHSGSDVQPYGMTQHLGTCSQTASSSP